MTPPARLQAAIEILDRYLGGEPLEKALTNWARRSRFAGSGDRAAIRDIVFDCVRRRASFAATGGGLTGRGLAIGYVQASGQQVAAWFSGGPYGPAPLSAEEQMPLSQDRPEHVSLDCPDWLEAPLRASLCAEFAPVMRQLQTRAAPFLRVNLRRATRAAAQSALAQDGVEARPHALAQSALQVTQGQRRIARSQAYLTGLVELQDVASQALCAALPAEHTMLDYCAGGGGKALAYADRCDARIVAHDADEKRLIDLPARAKRAGVRIAIAGTEQLCGSGPFDLVLCDVPCSGSGAWRRAPEGKWKLTPERLAALQHSQHDILRNACTLVAPGGTLAYATCSLLAAENEAQIKAFCGENPNWQCASDRRWTPLDGGDGFYIAYLTRTVRPA